MAGATASSPPPAAARRWAARCRSPSLPEPAGPDDSIPFIPESRHLGESRDPFAQWLRCGWVRPGFCRDDDVKFTRATLRSGLFDFRFLEDDVLARHRVELL